MNKKPVEICEYYRARSCLALQIATFVWLMVLFAGALFAYTYLHGQERYGVPAFIAVFIVYCYLTRVRAYRIKGHYVEVLRPLWKNRINASSLRKIRLDPNAMQSSFPVFANPGLFAFVGWFHCERYGMFRAFVSNRAAIIRLKLNDDPTIYMFSPEYPEHFLSTLRVATRKQGAEQRESRTEKVPLK